MEVILCSRTKDPWVLLSVLILNVFIREGTLAPQGRTSGSQRNNFPKSVSPPTGSQGSNSGVGLGGKLLYWPSDLTDPGALYTQRAAILQAQRRVGCYLVLVNEHQVTLLQLQRGFYWEHLCLLNRRPIRWSKERLPVWGGKRKYKF